MNIIFHGPIAGELHTFLEFKRSLGFGYGRAEFALREFEFLRERRGKRRWRLDHFSPLVVDQDQSKASRVYGLVIRGNSRISSTASALRVVSPLSAAPMVLLRAALPLKVRVKLVVSCATGSPVVSGQPIRSVVSSYARASALERRSPPHARVIRIGSAFHRDFKGGLGGVPFHPSLARTGGPAARVVYAPSEHDPRFSFLQPRTCCEHGHSPLHGLFVRPDSPDKGRVGLGLRLSTPSRQRITL